MKELQVFNNAEFGDVRSMLVDETPWFVGKDVAKALGYSNARKTLADHVDAEDKGVTKCDTLGGTQNLTIINESGLYSLIFGSKLPSAKKFKRWVTSEVLPALRKTGKYEVENTKAQSRIVKTCSGVPVVSLSDIDKFHELSPGTAALYFFNVFDRFTVNDDFYFADASDYNAAFGCNAPIGKPVALLNQRTYELLMFPYIPLAQIKAMIPEYFCFSDPKIVDCTQYVTAPKPSVIVEQPVAAIEQKPVENLTSELIIPNRGVRDRIDLTFSAYAATYNYYRSGKRIKTKNLHKVDGYGYLEGIGANILSHASHYGCAGYGPLTMRPDEDPHFCFPISSMRKDGKITIPKLGLFELKTPLWIEEGSRPVTATVRRTKDNKYMVEIRRKGN